MVVRVFHCDWIYCRGLFRSVLVQAEHHGHFTISVTDSWGMHSDESNKRCAFLSSNAVLAGSLVIIRDPPIMLIILPIMLCCTAQKFTYYA